MAMPTFVTIENVHSVQYEHFKCEEKTTDYYLGD